MKQQTMHYSDKKYQGVYSLFVQRSLVMLFLKDVINDVSPKIAGLEVDAWRYVFERDISKTKIIKNLTKSGINNLVALELVDKLNGLRNIVKEVYKNV